VAVSPDGSRIAFLEAQGNKRLAVYDTQTGRLIRMIYTDFHGQAQAAAFHPALPLIAAADSEGTIRLWDLDSGAVAAELTENGMAAVYSIHFSPDGERLICGSHDKMLRILDWKIGVVLLALEQTATPTSVAFSPDGSSITATNTLPSGGRIYRTIPWQE
jgi:WD40 repeat protein